MKPAPHSPAPSERPLADTQIQALVEVFHRAFQSLQVDVPETECRYFATTVQRAMTAHTRFYHTLDHIHMFIDPHDAVRTLAGLYHDIVYYQVDQQFTAEIEKLIGPYIHFRKYGAVQIVDSIPPTDRMIQMALEMFDLRAGQQFPSVAMINEFLSAVVMLKQLEAFVPAKQLILITLMIEATIPFRGRDEHGRTHAEVLAARLRRIGEKYCEQPPTEAETQNGVKQAVLFSNKDIESFAEPDPGHFLDNTWKLLPETNPFLFVRDLYSIRSYRRALQQMRDFLCRLDPDEVFSQYHGAPPEAEFNQIVSNAHINLRLGCEYLKIRIVAISLLEALAEVSGGDAAMMLFLAELPTKNGKKLRFDYFLPHTEPPSWMDTSSTIYRLLSKSRDSDWGYDPVSSPLSLYVYLSLPPEELSAAYELAQGMFQGQIAPDEYLRRFNQEVVAAVARASAEIVLTRRESLLQYARPESGN